MALLAPILASVILVTLALSRQLNETPEAVAVFTVAARTPATAPHTPTAAAGPVVEAPDTLNAATATTAASPPAATPTGFANTPSATATVSGTVTASPPGTLTPASGTSPSPTASATLTAAATSTPSSTATASPIVTTSLIPTLRKDQGCIESVSGDLYLYGELVNDAAVGVRITSVHATVRWNGGEQTWNNVYFEIPGDGKLAPNQALPYLIIVEIDRNDFQSYTLHPVVETATWTPRTDLRIDEYTPAEQGDAIDVTVKWTNTGANTPNNVTVYAVAYDDQNRIAGMDFRYLAAQSQLTPGQHTVSLLIDKIETCGAGVAVREAFIFGE
jgi:hypothetical protein